MRSLLLIYGEVMTYIDMADIVMAYMVMAYIVMAYLVMAYMVIAYMVMAYIVMACSLSRARFRIEGWGQRDLGPFIFLNHFKGHGHTRPWG